MSVSIHALAKSATWCSSDCAIAVARFNPRAREERDRQPVLPRSPRASFNPRAREERDSRLPSVRPWTACFNPRAREERDCV